MSYVRNAWYVASWAREGAELSGCGAPHRNHGDATLRDTLMGIAAMAFNEDKTIIEAQQKIIDSTREPQIMPTSADRGVTLFNRLVARLIREESNPIRQVS